MHAIDRAKSGVMPPGLVNFPLSRPILSSDCVSWEADQPTESRHWTMLFVCLEILIISSSHESQDAETLRGVRRREIMSGLSVE